MNRVKEYYELACEYLSLTLYGRYLVATHFQLVRNDILETNQDQLDRTVFAGVVKEEIFEEFKKFIERYKTIEANKYGSEQSAYLN